MKIVRSADWRDGLPFETPIVVATLAAGDPARCAHCPASSAPVPRTELWAIKHRHPNNHAGYVEFTCAEHTRTAVRTPPPAPTTKTPKPRRVPASPRPTPAAERPRLVCPDCFVEVPSSGACGICGATVPAPSV